MAKDIAGWLIMYAQQLEDQHAPDNLTIGMREAADEIERLRAALHGICMFSNLDEDGKTMQDIARAALGGDA